ncbi:MAG: F0F1 ATP synthase subunit epsilon [Planctomycetales bacterium]
MALPKQIRFVLVTPEKTLLDELVESVQFPLYDGQMGLLPGRAPLVGRVGFGELRLEREEGEQLYFVDGGFIQVKGEVVTLLTNRAIPAAELKLSYAEEQLAKADAERPHDDAGFAVKDRDVLRARRMIDLAKKVRRETAGAR